MMRKSFGQFETPEDQNPTGSQVKASTPPIMGTPMPNAGIKNQSMGNVSPPKDKPSPQQFAKRQAAGKRMKQMPNKSPLGPITGGPAKSQARPRGMPQARPQAGPQQQQQQPVGTGDRWMGELWQGLTLDGKPQGGLIESQRTPGFAGGGKIGNPPVGHSSPEMDLYNKVTMELESGGVAGYAHGGMVEQSREIASKGRNGDTMLMHIQPQELEGLQSLFGPLTINPETGNPEAFVLEALLATALLTGGGAGIGALAGGEEGAKKGALMGFGLGLTGGMAAGMAAPAAAGSTAAAAGSTAAALPPAPLLSSVAAAQTPAQAAAAQTAALMGPSSYLSSLGLTVPAPGAGVLAPGFGGGVSASQVPAGLTGQAAIDATMKAGQAGAGFQPSGLASLDKPKLLKALAQGGKSLQGQLGGQREGQAPPPPVPPSPAAPRPYEGGPSPEEMRRRRRASGIGTLPGSGSII